MTLFLQACVTACSTSPTYDVVDSQGSPMRLSLWATVPDGAVDLPVYGCPPGDSQGAISYAEHGTQNRQQLSFCFENTSNRTYVEDARLSRSSSTLKVCITRETGFDDDGAFGSIFLFDHCGSFDVSKVDE